MKSLHDLKRNNTVRVDRIKVSLIVTLVVILGVQNSRVFATSISESLNVDAIVLEKIIHPAPPQPNPVPNNGTPLPNNETGIDTVVFSGLAYPFATILVSKNGTVLHTATAGSDGAFEIPIHNIRPGTFSFGLTAKDSSGLSSPLVTYTVIIIGGIVTEVKGVIVPPTIITNKTEVKAGDEIVFSGKSIPSSELQITFFAKTGITKSVSVNASGTWSYTFPTTNFEVGDYHAKARTKIGGQFTQYSEDILFTIGTKNTIRKKGTPSLMSAKCDLNNDSRVNLLDFSIMAFWYKRSGFPSKVDLSSDGKINLTDLSILAYCWTG